jgi:hypothetical protein
MKGYLGWVVRTSHCYRGSFHDALLILENPCAAWLLGKLQRNAHHRARARTRVLLVFQLRRALVSTPGPQPAP